jgi:hypothetical protein
MVHIMTHCGPNTVRLREGQEPREDHDGCILSTAHYRLGLCQRARFPGQRRRGPQESMVLQKYDEQANRQCKRE